MRLFVEYLKELGYDEYKLKVSNPVLHKVYQDRWINSPSEEEFNAMWKERMERALKDYKIQTENKMSKQIERLINESKRLLTEADAVALLEDGEQNNDELLQLDHDIEMGLTYVSRANEYLSRKDYESASQYLGDALKTMKSLAASRNIQPRAF